MVWKPNVSVAAIVPRDDGRFLMVEEAPDGGPAVLNQPAGHLDFGETLSNAVVRETLEETAWQIEPKGIVGIYMYTKPGTETTYLRVCFHALATKAHSRELDKDIIRALWLNYDELALSQSRHRSPLVMQCVDDFVAGKDFPLDLIHSFPWQ